MALTDILTYIVLPLVVIAFWFLRKTYSYLEELGIPHPKPSWIMGNLSGVGSSFHMADLIKKMYSEYKGKDVISGFYTLISPTLVVTDFEVVKQITVKDFSSFTDRGFLVNEENEPLTGNLASIGGEKWHFLRTKLSPAFTSGKIKMMYETISDKGGNLVKAITEKSNSGSVDMRKMSSRFTIDVISSCAFGMEADTLNNENHEIVGLTRALFGEGGQSLLQFFLVFTYPRIAKFFNFRAFPKLTSDYLTEVITDTIFYREDKKVIRKDFLNMLIELKNKGSIDGEFSSETRKLTMNEVVAQAFIFFLGGSDTSSVVISFAITELGHHPEIQEKLRKEILEQTASSNGEITYDNLNEMTFLNQVVNGNKTQFKFGIQG